MASFSFRFDNKYLIIRGSEKIKLKKQLTVCDRKVGIEGERKGRESKRKQIVIYLLFF